MADFIVTDFILDAERGWGENFFGFTENYREKSCGF